MKTFFLTHSEGENILNIKNLILIKSKCFTLTFLISVGPQNEALIKNLTIISPLLN